MQTLIPEAINVLCRWALSEEEQFGVLGLAPGTDISRLKSLPGEEYSHLEDRCACITAIDRALGVLYADESLARRWIYQSNSHEFFRGQRPIDLLKTGDLETLRRISRMLLAWSAGN